MTVEYEISNLQGTLIPLAQILDDQTRINRDKKVVVHCRTGKRSAQVIDLLQKELGLTNLYNLSGGIRAWAEEIDSDINVY